MRNQYERKCKTCKTKFKPFYNQLQPCCSVKCAAEYAKKLRENTEAKELRDKHKELKEKTTDYADKLQETINKIIRLIDKGQPCLARGYMANQFHAGHIQRLHPGRSVVPYPRTIHRRN